jgi:hypothetical protein
MSKKISDEKTKAISKKENPKLGIDKKEGGSGEKIKKKNDRTITNFLIILGMVIVLIFVFYFYIQSQKYVSYKGIDFKVTKIGEGKDLILLYETLTLQISNDGSNQQFGFRIRTNPSKLKNVPFEKLENFNLLKLNGYSFEENYTFNCNGDGVIAMPNLERTFSKMGMDFILDSNSTCDSDGRYNFFYFKYGDKTKIKEIQPRCYDVIVKGNEDNCEILKATEKLMVEMYVKYMNL